MSALQRVQVECDSGRPSFPDPRRLPDFIALRGDPSDKILGARNVMISYRNLNTIVVVDRESNKIVWKTGMTIGQHNVHMRPAASCDVDFGDGMVSRCRARFLRHHPARGAEGDAHANLAHSGGRRNRTHSRRQFPDMDTCQAAATSSRGQVTGAPPVGWASARSRTIKRKDWRTFAEWLEAMP
jgi:hypothetical protein